MKTKDLVFMSMLLGIGFVLHSVVPGIFFGMKPDMLLTMMFLGIFLFPKVNNVLLLGVSTGIISALTTGFPAGQIPNVIDKISTAFIFFGLLLLVKKVNQNLIVVSVLTAIGTVVSGSVFLLSALLISSLPTSFVTLFLTIVLPTTVINTVAMIVIYPIVTNLKVRLKFS